MPVCDRLSEFDGPVLLSSRFVRDAERLLSKVVSGVPGGDAMANGAVEDGDLHERFRLARILCEYTQQVHRGRRANALALLQC
jgi:hypothetical protein